MKIVFPVYGDSHNNLCNDRIPLPEIRCEYEAITIAIQNTKCTSDYVTWQPLLPHLYIQ